MDTERLYTLCRMCDDRCGVEVELADGRVHGVRGNRAHLHSQGRVCAKARHAVEMVHHPERLTAPLRRKGSGWEHVDLEEALDEIAARVRRVQQTHGSRSVGIWKGEAIGFGQQEGLARRFAHAIGTPNYLSNDSMCFNGRYLGYQFTAGGHPTQDYAAARCVLIWGADPPATLPNAAHAIAQARKRGTSLVVIDPRRSRAARHATVHAMPRPGTDAALAWAIINETIAAGSHDPRIGEYSLGFEQAAEYARAYSVQRAEDETGVPAAVVREIATLLAGAAPAVAMLLGNGLEHHENGVDTVRSIACIGAVLGSFHTAGGQRFPRIPGLRDLTLYDEVPLEEEGPLGADRFPALYGERRECHTMTAIDAMLEARPYPLRGLILTAGNPALTHADSARTRRALASLDLLVVRDLFMTETAALAHYVLPAASFLERSELHVYPETKSIALSQRVVDVAGVQTEYEFWRALAWRLGAAEHFPWETERELNAWLLAPTGLPLEELEAHREGLPLPAMAEAEEGTFATPSGKFEFVSQRLADLGYDALPRYRPPEHVREPDAGRPFVLVTGARHKDIVHSRFHQLPFMRRDGLRPGVDLHPDDAAALGVEDGDLVVLESRTGSLEVPARVVEPGALRPGVVQLLHGWADADANLLTPADRLDPVSGFPAVREVPVSVRRATAPPTR